MHFHNGTFTKGKYITVRRGEEWFNITMPGERLILVDMETGSHSAIAKVLETQKIAFDNIEPDILKMSSNPECKSKQGLLHNMKSTYLDFDPKEKVTIILFEIL